MRIKSTTKKLQLLPFDFDLLFGKSAALALDLNAQSFPNVTNNHTNLSHATVTADIVGKTHFFVP